MEKPIMLLNLFTEGVQKKDEKAAEKYRQEILQLELDSQAAVIAQYRLGFFTLYQEKKLEEATEIFKKISSCSIPCDDFYQSHITYAICLWNQDKQTQAIFELRKMISNVPQKTIHELIALGYLTLFLRDTKGEHREEIKQLNEKRIDTLSALLQNEKDLETKSTFRIELAVALEERGQLSDLEQARIILKKVINLGSKITKPTISAARAALKRLDKPPAK